MTYRVKVSAGAAAQIRQAASWWLEHRPAARDVFLQEFKRAIDLIRTFPNSGQAFAEAEQIGARRVSLRRVRYHLYYVPNHEQNTVEVVALWHASRGSGPPL